METLVAAHDYQYLDRGIGTTTPEGEAWLALRDGIRRIRRGISAKVLVVQDIRTGTVAVIAPEEKEDWVERFKCSIMEGLDPKHQSELNYIEDRISRLNFVETKFYGKA